MPIGPIHFFPTNIGTSFRQNTFALPLISVEISRARAVSVSRCHNPNVSSSSKTTNEREMKTKE
jgi:hypothetical protein